MQSTVSQADRLRQSIHDSTFQFSFKLLVCCHYLLLVSLQLVRSLDSLAALHLRPWGQGHFPTKNTDLRVMFLRYKEKAHRDIFVPNKTQKRGQSAPAEVNFLASHMPFKSIMNQHFFISVYTRKQSCYSLAPFASSG